MTNRERARQLAHEAVARGEPLAWFEALYSEAESRGSLIPWADLKPNPGLVEWLERERLEGLGKLALKVGCGLGDDAEELASRGFDVVAFDISSAAIARAKRRFPASSVKYCVTDLFNPPRVWQGRFDLVQESYTLQVLPADLRTQAIKQIASFVGSRGTLLLITRARDECDDPGQMPWPLTRVELEFFQGYGLTEVRFEDYLDNETPPVRRFRIEYRKSA